MGKITYDQGVYIIEMVLKKSICIKIGKLGTYELNPGYYYYIGTAQRNLKARIARHLQKEKRLRWHIDYLLQYAEVLQIYTWPGERDGVYVRTTAYEISCCIYSHFRVWRQ
ncbi:hypothetical protein BBF96_00825 [Anoxybacter fermentans]|uniref:GIY-YIG domain-containing protein n=1 Tax=Anoxybacter fermentans TaxID=1323375 RepID=A0A3Q9HNK6_9FIRM|nr:GIY-YIG nuclease family protein [Anoxybacter fermentans]AZR72060.1 hypothetical protein BBF96_00825 [Anoxybacter fermentans]